MSQNWYKKMMNKILILIYVGIAHNKVGLISGTLTIVQCRNKVI